MRSHTTSIVLFGMVLAACNGTSSGTATNGGTGTAPVDTTANIDPLDVRTFAVGNGDFGDAMTNALTVAARQAAISVARLDRSTGEVTRIEDVTAAVKANASGFITLVIDGQEFPLEPGDLSNSTLATRNYPDGTYAVAFVGSQPNFVDILSNGNGFAERIGFQTRADGSQMIDLRGRTVIGMEMADSEVRNLGSATYSGSGGIEFLPAQNYVSYAGSVKQIDGRVALGVNLVSTEISGVMDQIQLRDPAGAAQTSIAGSIILNPAEFDVNAFEGTMTPDADLIANFPTVDVQGTATWSGAFFGPNGEEAGGAFKVDGTAGGEGVVGIGNFLTEKN